MTIDKQKKGNKSFIKENGFLIGLYSIVGILVVVAISITFFMPTVPKEDEIVQIEDSKNVSSNLAKSYKTQAGASSYTNITDSAKNPIETQTDTKTNQPNTQSKALEKSIVPNETQSNDEQQKSSSISTESFDTAKTTNNLVIFEDDQTLNEAQPSMSFSLDHDSDDEDSYTVESDFNGEKVMLWPTNGDVILGYSPSTLVYDATLEQYRTTDSIDIATSKGEDVFASYDGVVKMISKSIDQGNYIMIDHGNGWVTTYSQLDDSMKVSIGDQVKKGQQIGTIAIPSTQSVLLGTHLDFKVTKNDETINPLEVLE